MLDRSEMIGRREITEEDYAVYLFILREFSRDKFKNQDGSMPFNRIKAAWDKLYDDGVTDRAFSPERQKEIRNYLSGTGWLDVEDSSYSAVEGRAAKFSMKAAAGEMLDGLVSEKTTGGESIFTRTEFNVRTLLVLRRAENDYYDPALERMRCERELETILVDRHSSLADKPWIGTPEGLGTSGGGHEEVQGDAGSG